MIAKASLPQAVNAVGDRLGLNYNIDRKNATKNYIEEHKDASRLDIDQLRNSYYSLTESKTKKANEKVKQTHLAKVKNPLRLNCKVRKILYKLDEEEKRKLRYSTFEKVNELWQDYSQKITKEFNDPMTLFRLDLHGCLLKCTASKNHTLIGAEGIVVQETRNTFVVIKRTNRLITLPKRESIFEFNIAKNVYTIHGCNLLFTTQSRSKVKYKRQKSLSDI